MRSRSLRSTSKHCGALISSRLMPLNVGSSAAMMSTSRSTSVSAISMSNTSIPANFLKRTALPSITGLPARGPMLPSPKTAVPLVTTATIFCSIVSSPASAASRVEIVRDVASLRGRLAEWRRGGETIGLVPTMGALHAGHISLVHEAKKQARRVVMSIFVNPAQFAPSEDFDAYPRSFEADAALFAAAEGDLIFAPSDESMYGEGFATTISLTGPAAVGLEDRFRPAHFAGVATIVAKLLNQCRPDVA